MKHLITLSLAFCSMAIAKAQLPTTVPHSPTTISEYMGNGEIQVSISDDNPLSNNYNQSFEFYDENIEDTWVFEGYMIYQVRIPFPSLDFDNSNYFRLVAQSDVTNGVNTLSNWSYDPLLQECVPAVEVEGANTGLEFTYTFDTDAFTGLPFEEGEFYCYISRSYATNANGSDGTCDEPSTFIAGTANPSGETQIICSTVALGIEEHDIGNLTVLGAKEGGTVEIRCEHIAQVDIYSISGQLISSKQLEGRGNEEVKFQGLSTGICLIVAETVDGKPLAQKIAVP